MAAIDRYLGSPPRNKIFSICDKIQFNKANKALNSHLRYPASTSKIAGKIHKNIKLWIVWGLGIGECRNEKSLHFAANTMALRFALFQ